MSNPRYNSIFVASAMANINNAKIIASSATPGVSDYYTMLAKGFKISNLSTIAAGESVLGVRLLHLMIDQILLKIAIFQIKLLNL
jgi:primosomal protein N'